MAKNGEVVLFLNNKIQIEGEVLRNECMLFHKLLTMKFIYPRYKLSFAKMMRGYQL